MEPRSLFNPERACLGHRFRTKITPTMSRSPCSLLFLSALVVFLGCGHLLAQSSDEVQLARQIREDPHLRQVHQMARQLLKTGLTAGAGYGEVWIRDLNTFIEAALPVNDPAIFREALLTFFKFQGPTGDIPDGYIPRERANESYKYRSSALATNLLAHKNTVETDQETSLVQAIRKYIDCTGDRAILEERIGDRAVKDRLGWALDYLLNERCDIPHGLLWGATTADWGDVQPEHAWGVELDENSHRTIDIYDNAMFIVALNDYLRMIGGTSPEAQRWRRVLKEIKQKTRKVLWDSQARKFVPHVYLNGSPFPTGFDERAVYYHGGTAVAIEADLLSLNEIQDALGRMRLNVRQAGASSIGLTLYPAYPQGTFKNPSMVPYGYQNGGDWCWFGGRMIQQLIRHGLVADAYRELQPMVHRVQRVGDFHEWWSLDNQPRGSGKYRGSAGVLARSIEMLQTWAEQQTAAGQK